MALAVRWHESNFHRCDFFPKPAHDVPNPLIHTQPTSFLLQSGEHPHPLNKELIFKVFYKRFKYWIHPVEYRALKSDGTVVVGGFIYELKKKPNAGPNLKKYDFELLQLKFPVIKWVALADISHRVDFLLDDDQQLFAEYKALIRGVI